MPKQPKVAASRRGFPSEASQFGHHMPCSRHRNVAVWNDTDDQVLIAARASGLNWQPIATRHFPSKTANACRKRHERLMERRQHDEWDGRKLDTLATGYMECRVEMWSILAARLGERWSIVEAKCMEKGIKNLQAIARSAHKRAVAMDRAHQRGNEVYHHEGDSGFGCSDEEAEREVDEGGKHASAAPNLPPLQSAPIPSIQTEQHTLPQLPQLPLYQPPTSIQARARFPSRKYGDDSPKGLSCNQEQRHTSDEHATRGVSIHSMLTHS